MALIIVALLVANCSWLLFCLKFHKCGVWCGLGNKYGLGNSPDVRPQRLPPSENIPHMRGLANFGTREPWTFFPECGDAGDSLVAKHPPSLQLYNFSITFWSISVQKARTFLRPKGGSHILFQRRNFSEKSFVLFCRTIRNKEPKCQTE